MRLRGARGLRDRSTEQDYQSHAVRCHGMERLDFCPKMAWKDSGFIGCDRFLPQVLQLSQDVHLLLHKKGEMGVNRGTTWIASSLYRT